MKRLLVPVALCAAFVASAVASAPDEGTSASTTSAAMTPVPIHKSAQPENKTDHFTTAAQFIHQEIYTHLYTYGEVEALKSLFATNRTFRDRIRVDLGVRGAFRLELQAHPQSAMLDPWKELLQPGATMQHLIWARQMLLPQNLKRLGKCGLLSQLRAMPDKAKALALAAHTTEIFTEKMDTYDQSTIIQAALASSRPLSSYAARASACREFLCTENMSGASQAWIIAAALKASRPLSDYEALGSTCKTHLFTGYMDGWDQAWIIANALASSRPLSDYAALGSACKKYLLRKKMDGLDQAVIVSDVLPLSDTQLAQLVEECKARTGDNPNSRFNFIGSRTKELLAGK